MIKPRSPRYRLVVCVRNGDYPASLELRKIYTSIADAAAAKHGLLRVIDESGEDYLYPAQYFVAISLPSSIRRALRIDAPPRIRRGARRATAGRA